MKKTSWLVLAIALAAVTPVRSAPTSADNTEQNKGATEKNAVTAEKQNNRKSNVKKLAEIRQAIVKASDLSMNAKNVKILYSNGVVTLRGPVDSDTEKAKVEEIVKGCPDVSSVKNLLTVSEKHK